VVTNDKVEYSELQNLLKNKRKYMNNIIKCFLLIMKHKHKYVQYVPKVLMKIILEYMYDIDYLKCTKILI